jgi:hypothetical protein
MIKPKIRIRALMAIIAIVALGIWGEQMRRRRDYSLKKSLELRTKLLMMSFHFQHPLISAAEEEKLRRTYPHAAWHLEVVPVSPAYSHPLHSLAIKAITFNTNKARRVLARAKSLFFWNGTMNNRLLILNISM